ncbi:hypothetical protein MKY41_11515 [Sporosarcina sp. FSL W7-1349]|uniref:hypothetical protein n=1 Tax=Sporosarcina sp. FSL W7-1349 TaxID=2921561 RepID=UPI0030F6DB2C
MNKSLREQLTEIKKQLSIHYGMSKDESSLTIDNALLEAPQPLSGLVDKKKLATKRVGKERLSDRELRELMGVNRDVYRRGPGGAFRRR